MAAKRFDCLSDFARHGQHLLLICGNARCEHDGIVDAWSAATWFRLHRWSDQLDPFLGRTALDHFRCSICGHKAGRIRPTENAVTVTTFFPVDEKGWKLLARRLRD